MWKAIHAVVWSIGFALAATLAGCDGSGAEMSEAPAEAARPDPATADRLWREGLETERGGELSTAVSKYYEALKADPDHVSTLNHVAWMRATHPSDKMRNGAEAVRLAERAAAVSRRTGARAKQLSDILDTYAAAFAEAGRFDEAAETAEEAANVAESAGRRNAADSFRQRKQLYQSRKAYRD